MHRKKILDALDKYELAWQSHPSFDPTLLRRFRSFIQTNPLCFERRLREGHVTASALVTDVGFERVLLTHHRKANQWLQPGGHADGDPCLDRVARKEVEEETGLTELYFCPSPNILDVDIHPIPERPEEPAHLHYDVRYLLVTPSPDDYHISIESNDLRWFSIDEAYRITCEESIHRLLGKLGYYRDGDPKNRRQHDATPCEG